MIGRDARINLLITTGHFLSHFYQLCLPPLFLVWQRQFDISFAELGLSVVLMTGTAAVLQTPVGFLVDRYGARPFLIGGARAKPILPLKPCRAKERPMRSLRIDPARIA